MVLVYDPTNTFAGADTLAITTTDQGGFSDTDTVAINVESPNPFTLTVAADTVFYATGLQYCQWNYGHIQRN